MKLNRTIIACVVLGLAGTFSLARAEMPSTEAGAETATAHAKKPRTRIESLTEKLHLTDAQRLQVSAIIKDQQAAEAALKVDIATADVKKAKRREIKEAHNAQIRLVLTPEQQPVFNQTTESAFKKKKS